MKVHKNANMNKELRFGCLKLQRMRKIKFETEKRKKIKSLLPKLLGKKPQDPLYEAWKEKK